MIRILTIIDNELYEIEKKAECSEKIIKNFALNGAEKIGKKNNNITIFPKNAKIMEGVISSIYKDDIIFIDNRDLGLKYLYAYNSNSKRYMAFNREEYGIEYSKY